METSIVVTDRIDGDIHQAYLWLLDRIEDHDFDTTMVQFEVNPVWELEYSDDDEEATPVSRMDVVVRGTRKQDVVKESGDGNDHSGTQHVPGSDNDH